MVCKLFQVSSATSLDFLKKVANRKVMTLKTKMALMKYLCIKALIKLRVIRW